jgi:hypothetical protein
MSRVLEYGIGHIDGAGRLHVRPAARDDVISRPISCPELLPDLWEMADDFALGMEELLVAAR